MRDFVEVGGIRYVQFDATRAAGFTEALRVAELAVQHGAIVAPHTAPEIHGHLVSAFRGASFGVEVLTGGHGDALWRTRSGFRDGMFHLADEPGFGIEPDWEFVRKHAA